MGGYMGALQYLFGFKGRINRAKMWLFVLICFVVGIILSFFDPCSVDKMGGLSLVPLITKAGPAAKTALIAVVGLVNLLLFWASIALTVKRLHDRDKGAIWLLVFLGIPVVCVIAIAAVVGFSVIQHPNGFVPQSWMIAPLAISGLVLVVIAIWSFVEFYCLRGTRGPNRFGNDPLDGGPVYCDPEKPVEGCIPKP